MNDENTIMSHDVFLSHAHADKVFADAICHKLESHEIRCWVAPRDIHPSEDWAEAIINALDHAKVLLLVFSSSSNASPQVRREVERAVSKGLIILPFRIEDVPLSKSMEYFISTQHWLDAIKGDMAEHLNKLCEVAARLLNPGTLRSAAPESISKVETTQTTGIISQIPQETLKNVEDLLAKVLGPIARHLVKRRATAQMTLKELIIVLSQEIDNEQARQQFISACSGVI